jgi:hypothetical protein
VYETYVLFVIIGSRIGVIERFLLRVQQYCNIRDLVAGEASCNSNRTPQRSLAFTLYTRGYNFNTPTHRRSDTLICSCEYNLTLFKTGHWGIGRRCRRKVRGQYS